MRDEILFFFSFCQQTAAHGAWAGAQTPELPSSNVSSLEKAKKAWPKRKQPKTRLTVKRLPKRAQGLQRVKWIELTERGMLSRRQNQKGPPWWTGKVHQGSSIRRRESIREQNPSESLFVITRMQKRGMVWWYMVNACECQRSFSVGKCCFETRV